MDRFIKMKYTTAAIVLFGFAANQAILIKSIKDLAKRYNNLNRDFANTYDFADLLMNKYAQNGFLDMSDPEIQEFLSNWEFSDIIHHGLNEGN